MAGRSFAVHHYRTSQRSESRCLAGIGRILRASASVAAKGFRLLRTAPSLGDVGTRGNELTAWVEDWNRGGNPGNSNRE